MIVRNYVHNMIAKRHASGDDEFRNCMPKAHGPYAFIYEYSQYANTPANLPIYCEGGGCINDVVGKITKVEFFADKTQLECVYLCREHTLEYSKQLHDEGIVLNKKMYRKMHINCSSRLEELMY